MSTPCFIALEHDDGQLSVRYSHFDGYPQFTGKILLSRYRNGQIKDFMKAGMDLEGFDKEGNPNFQKIRDLMHPERMSPERFSLLVAKGAPFVQYVYVLRKNSMWEFAEAGSNHLGFCPLADALLMN